MILETVCSRKMTQNEAGESWEGWPGLSSTMRLAFFIETR